MAKPEEQSGPNIPALSAILLGFSEHMIAYSTCLFTTCYLVLIHVYTYVYTHIAIFVGMCAGT